ncbi:unnamed protein product [Rhizophagus irregularis]|nr:unnamed protein product [Rhizophagus irregularis]
MESPNNRLEKDELSSGNEEIDKFIKETIDENNCNYYYYYYYNHPLFLEWVPYERFENINQIGEGGFAKVYSATWSDGKIKYAKQDDRKWEKIGSEPMKIALKRIKGSHNMPPEYLNELKIYWNSTIILSYLDDDNYRESIEHDSQLNNLDVLNISINS